MTPHATHGECYMFTIGQPHETQASPKPREVVPDCAQHPARLISADLEGPPVPHPSTGEES